MCSDDGNTPWDDKEEEEVPLTPHEELIYCKARRHVTGDGLISICVQFAREECSSDMTGVCLRVCVFFCVCACVLLNIRTEQTMGLHDRLYTSEMLLAEKHQEVRFCVLHTHTHTARWSLLTLLTCFTSLVCVCVCVCSLLTYALLPLCMCVCRCCCVTRRQ